ncbi:hypothetical protein BDF20DRAFT_498329 [Mycotypha africana]|uniref:uncharacterized protein n=1 Tax=Mycotypha africana TaxID=64632 RepID=UPI0023011D10|nr:uncharacterized protein BDF20DRAFT_498329 [Mycotypha africana]KAI8979348.1 hypothetical protein BDF20DRAFT_498329 [Mycotypha africana]
MTLITMVLSLYLVSELLFLSRKKVYSMSREGEKGQLPTSVLYHRISEAGSYTCRLSNDRTTDRVLFFYRERILPFCERRFYCRIPVSSQTETSPPFPNSRI